MTARIQLPVPSEGLTAALMVRRSVRDYDGEPVSLAELSRLFWAGQGVSHSSGKRTVPSPNGLHPLSLYLVAGRVDGADTGLYRYEPRVHALEPVGHGDLRDHLYGAAFEDQPWIRDCAALIVVAGDVARVENEFADQPPAGKRGRRYVYLEAGAAAQNIALQAAELELGSVLVGGFDDDRVKRLLGIGGEPLVLLPVGRPAT